MTFDERLSIAAAEAAEIIAASLPNEEDCPDDFSENFLQTMQDFIDNWDKHRKKTFLSRHPVISRVLIAAAVIILIFGALVAFSPEVRAALAGWFSSINGTYTDYNYRGSSIYDDMDEADKPKFEVTWVPEGYTFYEKSENVSISFYYLKDNNSLVFSYLYGSESTAMYILSEAETRERVTINGHEGELIIPISKKESPGLIWIDTDLDILFCVDGFEDKDTLIRIAESVKQITDQ